MASQPHNHEGRKCNRCLRAFTAQSMTLTIPSKKDCLITHELVCAECHHKHYSRGE